MDNNLDFIITTMPDSRPADYYLGCCEGSVYIDFDNYDNKRICLVRISFDGYGCCDMKDLAIPMNEVDSSAFKEIIKSELADQSQLTVIVKKTIFNNRDLIWEDALVEYGLNTIKS